MTDSNLRILAYEPSPLGVLCLRQRTLLSDPSTVVTEVSLDGEHLMSDATCASEQALATQALARHSGEGLRVLVGGLGLGITAAEVLASSRVSALQVVEFLPQVIGWFTGGLLPLSGKLLSDPRSTVTQGDVYRLLTEPPAATWDLILIDVDHSPDEPLGPQSAGFHAPAGLRRARAHLEPAGLLGVWSYAPSDAFERSLRDVFARVWALPVSYVDATVDEDRTDWIYLAGG